MPKKPKRARKLLSTSVASDEMAKALSEDRKVQKILRNARNRAPRILRAEQSIRQGNAIMTRFRKASERMLRSRIKQKKLLTKDELTERIGGNRQWVSYAIKTGRIFSVRPPSGIDYFPAFFAADLNNRRALGKVAQALARLPASSKYYFFITESLALQKSPLDALANGELKAVLAAASGFVNR